eukprot:14485-Heterococcus_DN1.PRE.1
MQTFFLPLGLSHGACCGGNGHAYTVSKYICTSLAMRSLLFCAIAALAAVHATLPASPQASNVTLNKNGGGGGSGGGGTSGSGQGSGGGGGGGGGAVTPPVIGAGCDELSSFEPQREPLRARRDFEQAFQRYPTRTPLGTCGDVRNFPSSISRPTLFSTPMFTDFDGNEAINNAAMDLRVVQSYSETEHIIDLYETITIKQAQADLFAGNRTNPAVTTGTAFDACRPAGYEFTGIWSYSNPTNGAHTPGPTHKNCFGRQTVLRFCSEVPRPTVVHLHGSPSVSPFDGWAENTEEAGNCKDYFYPNSDSRILWYHDHAIGITADNAYAGLAAQYHVLDCSNPVEINYLPQDRYSLPMTLKDVVLTKELINGEAALLYEGGRLNVGPNAHINQIYGDINLVNGKPWPFHKVEPRAYRFAFLTASVSRPFSIKFIAETADDTEQEWVDFYLLGTDGGFLLNARK